MEEADLTGVQAVAADEAFLAEANRQIHSQAQARAAGKRPAVSACVPARAAGGLVCGSLGSAGSGDAYEFFRLLLSSWSLWLGPACLEQASSLPRPSSRVQGLAAANGCASAADRALQLRYV